MPHYPAASIKYTKTFFCHVLKICVKWCCQELSLNQAAFALADISVCKMSVSFHVRLFVFYWHPTCIRMTSQLLYSNISSQLHYPFWGRNLKFSDVNNQILIPAMHEFAWADDVFCIHSWMWHQTQRVKPMKDSLTEGDHSSELKSPLLANDLILILMFKSTHAACSQICPCCTLQNYRSVKGINLFTFLSLA